MTTDDDFITVTTGAPQIEPGVYEVTLISISDVRVITAKKGPNAGQDVELRDWTFALEDGTPIEGSASTNSGPRSKSYAWLTALLGGTPPVVGQAYPKSQLVGREALATIELDEGGWPRIANLSAKPKARAAAPAAARPVRPVAPVAAGIADDLPF